MRLKLFYYYYEININIAIDPGNKLSFYRNQSDNGTTQEFEKARKIFVKTVCQIYSKFIHIIPDFYFEKGS